jgi:hypothetical protein
LAFANGETSMAKSAMNTEANNFFMMNAERVNEE